MKIIKYCSWVLVFLLMVMIFYLSHQPVEDSRHLSTRVTDVVVKVIEVVSPQSDLSMERMHHLVRKNAHFFTYMMLGSVMVLAVSRWLQRIWMRAVGALGICVLFAISDEVHQIFVPGRGAQVRDVVIDSFGALTGIGLCLVVQYVVRNLHTRKSPLRPYVRN